MTSHTTIGATSATALDGLQPERFWALFGDLTQVPRKSRNEGPVREYIQRWATSRDLATRSDAAGNMVIEVPATPGHEDAPRIILQGHLDMVCERDPSSPNDAEAGRIELARDGVWLTADGTTLGADDGVAIAAMQALVEDPTVVHGPLQLLMTVAEEVGLEGANALDPALLDGSILINLDSEEDGRLTVGCAGSTDTWVRIAAPKEPVTGAVWFRVAVTGGRGGHSGSGIVLNHSNAVKVLGSVLAGVANDVASLRVHAVDGGRSRNAIPRDAIALVCVDSADAERFTTLVAEQRARIAAQFAVSDPGVAATVEAADGDAPASAWSIHDTRRMLDAIMLVPTGPLVMSQSIDGLVETSSSLGEATTDGDELTLHSLSRSSNDHAMPDLVGTFHAIARLTGGSCEVKFNYAGWQPNMASPVLAAARRAYEQALGEPPIVTAVHAGLETAVIGAKVPGLDMLAIGPQIENPHSPDERVDTESVARFWALLVALLRELS